MKKKLILLTVFANSIYSSNNDNNNKYSSWINQGLSIWSNFNKNEEYNTKNIQDIINEGGNILEAAIKTNEKMEEKPDLLPNVMDYICNKKTLNKDKKQEAEKTIEELYNLGERSYNFLEKCFGEPNQNS